MDTYDTDFVSDIALHLDYADDNKRMPKYNDRKIEGVV